MTACEIRTRERHHYFFADKDSVSAPSSKGHVHGVLHCLAEHRDRVIRRAQTRAHLEPGSNGKGEICEQAGRCYRA